MLGFVIISRSKKLSISKMQIHYAAEKSDVNGAILTDDSVLLIFEHLTLDTRYSYAKIY